MKTTTHLTTLRILSGLYERLATQARLRSATCAPRDSMHWFVESSHMADKAHALRNASAVQS